MNYTRNDFLAAQKLFLSVDEQLENLDQGLFAGTPVRAVPFCHITGTLHFDGRSRVVSNLHLEGVLTVPDSITDEDVNVDFESDSAWKYSFDPVEEDDEEGDGTVVVKRDTIDLIPEVVQAIVYEAPMSITSLKRDEYPKGEGWVLLSDQDEPDQKEEIDPRWAKLQEFQFDDD